MEPISNAFLDRLTEMAIRSQAARESDRRRRSDESPESASVFRHSENVDRDDRRRESENV